MATHKKIVITDQIAVQLMGQPSIRELLPCMQQFGIREIQGVAQHRHRKGGCSGCGKKRRAVDQQKATMAAAAKKCLFQAPGNVIALVKQHLQADTIVIYLTETGLPNRVVK